MISEVKGSLILAAVVLWFDVLGEGFCTLSLLVCPFWFLISFIKNASQRPARDIAVLRVSVPLLTLAIAVSNAALQWEISDRNADRVIKACEEFRAVNGHYPNKLEELVPDYLPSVLPAKHCAMGRFWYSGEGDYATLGWPRYGFYRRFYDFKEKRWSNRDM